MYTQERLRQENETYAGTGGVSENNAQARFLPAFREQVSGRIELARMEDGRSAPMHLLCGLPDDWVTQRDTDGRIIALKDSVIAGFVRDGDFFTREEAARLTAE